MEPTTSLNEQIYMEHLERSLEEVLIMYRESFLQVMETIKNIPDEALFMKGLYTWMNKNKLAAYFTLCTSSHYRWARKELLKGFQAKK